MEKRLLMAGLLCFLLSAAAWADPALPGEALVIFRAQPGVKVTAAGLDRGLESFRLASLAASAGARVLRSYGALSEADGGIYALLKSETLTTEQLLKSLRARPDVEAASPNFIVRALAGERLPDDPLFGELWGMRAIRAPEAWAEETGSDDIYVVVLDTGTDPEHPDLKDNLARDFSRNFWSRDSSTPPDPTQWQDEFLHGTHVAGTIGAAGDNGIGVAGVNWKVRIITFRTMGPDGSGTTGQAAAALNELLALLRARPDMKIAAVNLSLGAWIGDVPENRKKYVDYRALRVLSDMDRTLIIVAAGNEGMEVGAPAPFDSKPNPENGSFVYRKGDYCYPASDIGLDNMIVVGAISRDLTAAYFTNWSSERVDLAAPGVAILSTMPSYSTSMRPEEGVPYGVSDGTSMATPHVVGAAALVLAAHPNLKAHEVKAALLNGANRTRPELTSPLFPFRRDPVCRYGLLDVKGALDWIASNPHPERIPAPEHMPWDPYESCGNSSGCDAGFGLFALLTLFLLVPLLRSCGRKQG